MLKLSAFFHIICLGALSIVGASDAATPAAATAQGQLVNFSVFLPMQNGNDLAPLLADLQNPGSSNYHKWLTPDQFNARFGPAETSLANVKAALQNQGFTVVGTRGREVQVAGSAAAVSRTFSTTLSTVTPKVGSPKLMALSPLVLPPALKLENVVITAFTGLPRLHSHLRRATTVSAANPANRYTPSGGYWFDDLKQAYGYPSYQSYDGTGASVAVLMSSDAYDSDIALMFNHEKFSNITNKPAPTIAHQPVGQATTSFTDALDEASLDVQQVLGGAPGAKVTLVDVPDLSDQNLIEGYTYIVNAKTSTGSAMFQLVNSSFGGCELEYTAAYNGGVDYLYLLKLYQDVFNQGNAEGITFVASSGDSGGLGCPDVNYGSSTATAPSRFVPGVEFPASSQNVTAVGGGNLLTTYNPPSLDSVYTAENAQGDPELPYDPYGIGSNVFGGYWGAGGGISAIFTKPSYQALVNTGSAAYRTVPDVGMQVGGCPGGISVTPCGPNRSYVITAIQGSYYGLIGTSVASPEFVGALALYVQKTGAGLGNINTYLYKQAASANVYNRNIPGFDGRYTNATPGGTYDYLVGNGTPRVANLFGMTGVPLAGAPQTASNP
jgi:subtilase family serine protease